MFNTLHFLVELWHAEFCLSVFFFAVVHWNAKLMKSHADEPGTVGHARELRGAQRSPGIQGEDDEVARPPLTVINAEVV